MMLRKILVILCFSATNAMAQVNKITEKQAAAAIDYKQTGAPMPMLLLITSYDTSIQTEVKNGKKKEMNIGKGTHKPYINNDDLDNGANLFVMMFNPTCSHCEDETELLEKNISLFRKSKIVMVAAKPMKPYMPDFIRSFHINEYPAMYIGTDSTNFIDNVFLYTALPQINIYDNHRKLIKTYTGHVEIDSLKQFIE